MKLSNPTNGALIGPHSTLAVDITGSPAAPSSGGGGVDWLTLLLLAFAARLVRQARRLVHR